MSNEPFSKELLSDWEKYFRDESSRKRGGNIYPGVFDGACFPLQRKRELIQMMMIARNYQPRVVMEIGADKGGGLYHWVKCLPTVQVAIACEIRGCPYKHLFEKAFPDVTFGWIERGSRDLTDVEKAFFTDWIDCLFIDGDKGKMVEDFDYYLPMVRKPGVVFLHDVQDREPRAAFNTIKDRGLYKTQLILDKSEVEEELVREKEGLPPLGNYGEWLRHWKGRSCGVGVVHVK